jgi:hypothetical protein
VRRYFAAGLLTTFLASAWLGFVVAQQPEPPPIPPAPDYDSRHDPSTGCARAEGFNADGLRLVACACHPQTELDGEECRRVTEDSQCQKYCRADLCFCAVSCEHPGAGPVHLMGHRSEA